MTTRDTPGELKHHDNSERDDALLVDARKAAALLGIGRRLLWSLTNAREIPHVRIRRRIAYPVAALKAWIAARTKGDTR